MDFNTAEELIKLCESGLSIADAMRKRETVLGETDADTVEEKMKKALGIMRDSAHKPIETHFPTTGGLIGGEASKLNAHAMSGKSICGTVLTRALIYSQAVPEVNASMGVIVAAPTAGSSGVVPAVLFALEDEFGLDEKRKRFRCTGRLSGRDWLIIRNGCRNGNRNDGRYTRAVL